MSENVDPSNGLHEHKHEHDSIILFGIPLDVSDVSPSSPISSYSDAMEEYRKKMETIYSKYNFLDMENEGGDTDEHVDTDEHGDTDEDDKNDVPDVPVLSDDIFDYSNMMTPFIILNNNNNNIVSVGLDENTSKLVTFNYNMCDEEHIDGDDIALKAIMMEEEYALAYTQPILQHIAGYYGLKRSTSKKIIIQNIVEFELNPDNVAKVSERHRMFNYFNELKKDPYMSIHMIVPI